MITGVVTADREAVSRLRGEFTCRQTRRGKPALLATLARKVGRHEEEDMTKKGSAHQRRSKAQMKSYTAVIERCPDTNLYVGYVPGFPGAHSQGATLEELDQNLQEVIEMLLEDGEPTLEAEFIGTHTVRVA